MVIYAGRGPETMVGGKPHAGRAYYYCRAVSQLNTRCGGQDMRTIHDKIETQPSLGRSAVEYPELESQYQMTC